jgi:hypothetical protein
MIEEATQTPYFKALKNARVVILLSLARIIPQGFGCQLNTDNMDIDLTRNLALFVLSRNKVTPLSL